MNAPDHADGPKAGFRGFLEHIGPLNAVLLLTVALGSLVLLAPGVEPATKATIILVEMIVLSHLFGTVRGYNQAQNHYIPLLDKALAICRSRGEMVDASFARETYLLGVLKTLGYSGVPKAPDENPPDEN